MTWQTKMATETPFLVRFRSRTGGTSFTLDNLPEGAERYGCGGPQADGYGQYCQGGVVLPIELEDSGTYTLSIKLRGDQLGGEPVRVMVSIDSNLDALEEFRYAEGDTWYKDMREPGFLASEVPESTPSLQWLAAEIVKDPWFAESAVKFWWPSLMGPEVVSAPEVVEDASLKRNSRCTRLSRATSQI